VEAAQRFLEAKERFPVGSENWAKATGGAFDNLKLPECNEVTKPEWWNNEELKGLSVRVVRAAPNHVAANGMRASILRGACCAWEAGPRSAAELKEAATHFEQAAALCGAPGLTAVLAENAANCRSLAEAM